MLLLLLLLLGAALHWNSDGAPTPPPLGGARPIWSANATAQFVLLRRPFDLPVALGSAHSAVLHISAQPVPNRLAGPRHGGSLASKLLSRSVGWARPSSFWRIDAHRIFCHS
eukprot:SAG31_NODE_2819_length_5041_cov_10.089235_5_plen_112_part_00